MAGLLKFTSAATFVQAGADRVTAAAASSAEQASAGIASTADSIRLGFAEAASSVSEQIGGAVHTGIRLLHGNPDSATSDDDWHACENTECGPRTQPPLRFRMTSADYLSHRSMEIEWENGTGERQHWSSYQDSLCGWFEAEKVLPASATDILVRFQVHAVLKSQSRYVSKVDRTNRCSWIKDGKCYAQEVIWFNTGSDCHYCPVDATFQLKGAVIDCHVSRAWNAARVTQVPDCWEFWDDIRSRPKRSPLMQVLQAADAAAPPDHGAGDPILHCTSSTKRLVGAAKALHQSRRDTIGKLRELDEKLTAQWVTVNGTNTVSAGLAVASAVSLFVAPPIGIGLGLGSAAAGGLASAGDVVSDHVALGEIRQCLIEDDVNSLCVADLQTTWLQARDHAGAVLKASDKSSDAYGLAEIGLGVSFGFTVARTAAGFVDEALGAAAVAAESASVGSKLAPVASKVLGVAGAVVATGMAVHGWVTTKSLQATLRRRLAEITSSMLDMQRWLAAMTQLECSICLGSIRLSDEAQCCNDSWHYSHAKCLKRWARECSSAGRDPSCPLCCGNLSARTGVLEKLIADDMCKVLDSLPL